MGRVSRKGSGRFQWNGGGWFGAQIGSTLWLALLAGFFLLEDPGAGALVLLCFLLPNAIGGVLWWRRDRVAPYPALQGLIAAVGLFALLATLILDRAGYLNATDPRIAERPLNFYSVLLIFPFVMALFHLHERGAKKSDR